jgi:hypothetical protein
VRFDAEGIRQRFTARNIENEWRLIQMSGGKAHLHRWPLSSEYAPGQVVYSANLADFFGFHVGLLDSVVGGADSVGGADAEEVDGGTVDSVTFAAEGFKVCSVTFEESKSAKGSVESTE